MMKKVYRFLGLIENHQMVLDVSKNSFIELLRSHVGTDTNSSMDIFSSGNIDFKGSVGYGGFYLRKRRGFFDKSRPYCKAIGTFREENDKLIIDIEFNNISPPIIFVYAFFLLFDLISIFGIITNALSLNFTEAIHSLSNLVSVVVFSAIVAGITYFVSKRTIEKMKYLMESNFYNYLTKKYPN